MIVAPGDGEPPSICSVRKAFSRLFLPTRTGSRRNIIVLAIDGIPYSLAVRHWGAGRTRKLRSVFPTTSVTAWLSSTTGLSVDDHGIPGVVFKSPLGSGELINVYDYGDVLPGAPFDNIFADAARCGYRPVAVSGDMANLECTWRDVLLAGAEQIGVAFYPPLSGMERSLSARVIAEKIDAALAEATQTGPAFVWCFIETDRYVHCHGYDDHVPALLAQLDRLARRWAAGGALVAAYSDHGLVPTTNCPRIADALDSIEAEGHGIGGAGRVRWVYVEPGDVPHVRGKLRKQLPQDVRLIAASDVFREGSAAARRVGPLLLLATSDKFVAPGGYRYEHGSLSPDELFVPLATWLGQRP